ncbi:MAG TPA: SxtJ family membrane protein [Verrucomicrobiae bacterium]|jgi:multisubunit Na+/H+ antiporter MnhG subunit|nr:SxtJ family membrane protein [Verrucomicrobiae bacterium]
MKPKFSENPKEWRKGAWMSALGLAIFSSLLRWRRVLRPTTWVIVLAILAAIAVAAAIQPRWFRGFHRFSARLGFAISQLAGRIVLAVFFILLVTPVSLIRRALGKDPLRLQRPKLDTYWTPAPPKTPLDRMF